MLTLLIPFLSSLICAASNSFEAVDLEQSLKLISEGRSLELIEWAKTGRIALNERHFLEAATYCGFEDLKELVIASNVVHYNPMYMLNSALSNRAYPDVFPRVLQWIRDFQLSDVKVWHFFDLAIQKRHIHAIKYLAESYDVHRALSQFGMIIESSVVTLVSNGPNDEMIKYLVDKFGFDFERIEGPEMALSTSQFHDGLAYIIQLCPQVKISESYQQWLMSSGIQHKHFKLTAILSSCCELSVLDDISWIVCLHDTNLSQQIYATITILTLHQRGFVIRICPVQDLVSPHDIISGNIEQYLNPQSLFYHHLVVMFVAVSKFALPKTKAILIEKAPGLLHVKLVGVHSDSKNVEEEQIYAKELISRCWTNLIELGTITKCTIQDLIDYEEDCEHFELYSDESV